MRSVREPQARVDHDVDDLKTDTAHPSSFQSLLCHGFLLEAIRNSRSDHHFTSRLRAQNGPRYKCHRTNRVAGNRRITGPTHGRWEESRVGLDGIESRSTVWFCTIRDGHRRRRSSQRFRCGQVLGRLGVGSSSLFEDLARGFPGTRFRLRVY